MGAWSLCPHDDFVPDSNKEWADSLVKMTAADLGAAPPDGLGFEGTEKGWYRVTVETDGPDRYRLLASPGPGSPQVLDEDCREFWIDQTGARGSSPEPASVCWR